MEGFLLSSKGFSKWRRIQENTLTRLDLAIFVLCVTTYLLSFLEGELYYDHVAWVAECDHEAACPNGTQIILVQAFPPSFQLSE